MGYEIKITLKMGAVTCFKTLPQHVSGDNEYSHEKTSTRMSGLRTWDLPNVVTRETGMYQSPSC
jgi:hypothetical protein